MLYRQKYSETLYEFLAYCDCPNGRKYNLSNEEHGKSKGNDKRRTLSIHEVFSPWEIDELKKINIARRENAKKESEATEKAKSLIGGDAL